MTKLFSHMLSQRPEMLLTAEMRFKTKLLMFIKLRKTLSAKHRFGFTRQFDPDNYQSDSAMQFETIIVQEAPRKLTATISRPNRGNSINSTLIRELGAALDLAERLPGCRTLVLEGAQVSSVLAWIFTQVAANSGVEATETAGISDYMLLLKRFTLSSKVIVCRLDGKVIAGGVDSSPQAISSSQPNARNSAFRRRSGVCCLVV